MRRITHLLHTAHRVIFADLRRPGSRFYHVQQRIARPENSWF